MPRNTPKVKINNVIRNGGQIIWCDPNQASREKVLNDILNKTKSILVHPYNDERIIEGQGTVALELIEQCPEIEAIISPVSGGGLLGGTICTAKKINDKIKIYGAEPKEADDAFRSIKSGVIKANKSTNTICDGLRAQIGTLTFPIIKNYVADIFTITLHRFMKLLSTHTQHSDTWNTPRHPTSEPSRERTKNPREKLSRPVHPHEARER